MNAIGPVHFGEKRSRGSAAPIVYLTRGVRFAHHAQWLETFGFRVVHGDNGRRAFSEFKTLAPRLVVVSIGAADRENVDFIRWVRSTVQTSQPLLIALSDGTVSKAALEEMGVDAVLTEPVDSLALRGELRGLLALPPA